MTVTEQKDISKEILKKLTINVDSSAIIAGGAPRNWEQNILARDVDIYFRTHVSNINRLLDLLFNDGTGDFQLINTPDSEDIYMGTLTFDIKRVLTARYKGVDFQFIIVEEKEPYIGTFSRKIVESFLVNISKIYMMYLEGSDTLFYITTLEYRQDIRDNLLTIEVRKLSGTQLYKGVQRYLPKIQSYYPNNTVIFKEN